MRHSWKEMEEMLEISSASGENEANWKHQEKLKLC